jgi:hypothetical protein
MTTDADGESTPTTVGFSETQIDVDLEPPTLQLFNEYKRVSDSMDQNSPPNLGETDADKFDGVDRFVSRIIDIEMPIHIALLRAEVSKYYGVRENDSSLQRQVDDVIESLVSQELATWEQVDGSVAARGQFLNNPVFSSSISARRPRQSEPRRDIKRIAISELQAGVSSVMWAMYTASRSVLISEMARQLGYEKLDGIMHDRIGLAIDRMIEDGRLLDQPGGLTLKE